MAATLAPPKKNPAEAGFSRSSHWYLGNVYSAGTGVRPVIRPSRFVPSA